MNWMSTKLRGYNTNFSRARPIYRKILNLVENEYYLSHIRSAEYILGVHYTVCSNLWVPTSSQLASHFSTTLISLSDLISTKIAHQSAELAVAVSLCNARRGWSWLDLVARVVDTIRLAVIPSPSKPSHRVGRHVTPAPTNQPFSKRINCDIRPTASLAVLRSSWTNHGVRQI